MNPFPWVLIGLYACASVWEALHGRLWPSVYWIAAGLINVAAVNMANR